MADVNATRTQLLALFKEVYGERVAEQPNRTTFILNEFDASTRRFGGKYWTAPMLDEGGQAVGSFNEDEQVEDAQGETSKEIQIRPRQHYALVRISGLAIAASKQNLYAFVQAKDFEIKNKTKWLLSHLNVQFYGRGDGRLGAAASASDAPDSIVMAVGTNMNWFRKGLKVDVWNAAVTARRNSGDTTSKNQGWQITSVVKSTRTLNFGNVNPATAGVIAGDFVYFQDAKLTGSAAAAESTGKQITGLASLVDDTSEGVSSTIQNIDRTTFTIFRSSVLSNGGTSRALSLDLVQQLSDAIAQESGEEPDWMVGGYGQRRNYLNLLWYDVRYGPKDLRGGFEVLKYNNLDWVVDKDCQLGRIYAGMKDSLKKYVVAPIGILDQAGPQMERVPKTDVHELLIGGYFNAGIERPNTWGKMVDLTEP